MVDKIEEFSNKNLKLWNSKKLYQNNMKINAKNKYIIKFIQILNDEGIKIAKYSKKFFKIFSVSKK